MTWELALEIILDSLKDSGLVFAFVFLLHVIIAFFDTQIETFLSKRRKTGVVFGSLFGLIPQCGTSVLGADLYIKKYISLGTLVAIFLSCSDEAFIAILTSGSPKTIMILPLIGLKFAIGVVVGILIDLIYRKQDINKDEPFEDDHECHVHHHKNNKLHKFFIHPLIHSLQIFAYVLVINLAIGFIIGFVGEENFTNFMLSSKYLSPLYCSIFGLIPNCATSLLITELYLENTLPFGALLAGLLVNSGLGMMLLLKNFKKTKNTLLVIGICFLVAVASGYLTCLISGF